MSDLTIHSDVAWGIASQYSYTLASDTRGLAGQIDQALSDLIAERDAALTKVAELEGVLGRVESRIEAASAMVNDSTLWGEDFEKTYGHNLCDGSLTLIDFVTAPARATLVGV